MNQDNLRLLPSDAAAVTTLVHDWHGRHPGMSLLALLPEAERAAVPMLQQVCRAAGVPLVGAIFPQLVTRDGFTGTGLWLLRFDREVPAFLVPALAVDPVTAAGRIAAPVQAELDRAASSAGTRPTLYLIIDALLQNVASLLDDLYLRLADRVNYAGVAAGSETFQPMPCVFDGEHLIDEGALALLIPGDVKTILEHGCPAPEKVMTATSTEGNRIINIDWRPAFEVYQQIVRTEGGVELTRENFYQWAVHFPFGILRANQEVVVRIPVALTDDGCVYCIGEVPENAMLVVLRVPGLEDGDCVRRLSQGLVQANGSLADDNLLAFYCAGRRLHLGDDAAREVQALAQATGARQVAGALSLGELGSTTVGGYPLFHNATLVCTPWRRE